MHPGACAMASSTRTRAAEMPSQSEKADGPAGQRNEERHFGASEKVLVTSPVATLQVNAQRALEDAGVWHVVLSEEDVGRIATEAA